MREVYKPPQQHPGKQSQPIQSLLIIEALHSQQYYCLFFKHPLAESHPPNGMVTRTAHTHTHTLPAWSQPCSITVSILLYSIGCQTRESVSYVFFTTLNTHVAIFMELHICTSFYSALCSTLSLTVHALPQFPPLTFPPSPIFEPSDLNNYWIRDQVS